MKFTVKKIMVILTIIFTAVLINSNVLAANLNVQVNCTGKTIKMISETPDMTWTIKNLLPGEKDESTVTIENVGVKKVDVDLTAKIESGEDLTNILDLKIIKIKSENSEEQELYSGKYSELKSVKVSIESNNKETYKFVVTLPTETGNEYQGKECVVKLGLIASGEADTAEPKKIITTNKVESPQTGEGVILFIVAGVLIIAFIIFLITFFINRKDKKE